MTIQYDTDPSHQEDRWISVPGCSDPEEQTVCRFQPDGEPDTVRLLATGNVSPAVRYRAGQSPMADLSSAANDLLAGLENTLDGVRSWLGIGGGEGSGA